MGRPDVISQRLERAGLSIKAAQDFDIVNPESDDRYRDYWQSYYDVMKRKGVTPDLAKASCARIQLQLRPRWCILGMRIV